MRPTQTDRYIYNEDGKRIRLPMELEKAWDKERFRLNPNAKKSERVS